MKASLVFISFLFPEYLLRTYIGSYKYHTSGTFMESLPLFIATILSSLLYIKEIKNTSVRKSILMLSTISILGYLFAKAILFYQHYWILHPEYRQMGSDMDIGLSFTIFFGHIWSAVIILSYFGSIITVKAFKKY